MVDDKKDRDNDYSALSDALDSGESAPSLEDLLKDHGIDLGSDVDLDAMQDFSLNNKSDTSDTFDLDEMLKGPTRDTALHDDSLFSDNLFDEPAFAETAPLLRRVADTKPAPVNDEHLFDSSDFEDVSTELDVDESETPMNDEDALFDYDPHTEASFADVGSAEPELGGGDMGGGGEVPPPGAGKGPGAKRILARLGIMVVLVATIYGGLKLFTTSKTATPPVAEATTATPPPSQIAHMPEVTAATPAPTPAPTMPSVQPPVASAPPATPAMPETAVPSAAPVPAMAQAPTMPETVAASATPVPATAQAPTNGNAVDMHQAEQSPQTSMNVSVPAATEAVMSPVTPNKVTMGGGDVHEKLDNLENAIKSIDQRLAQVGTSGMGEEKMQRLERLVNDSSAPEMQDVLREAVKKMKELDRKLERISELQQQVRKLDMDVKMLKEDIVTQTNVVGEQQRLFNDNVQLSQMQEPGPVKMMVQAAIPGRAWLRSERGELLTVIPGDEVPGYGRVVSIDAASGTVVTSSRAVFREQ